MQLYGNVQVSVLNSKEKNLFLGRVPLNMNSKFNSKEKWKYSLLRTRYFIFNKFMVHETDF